jgi:hypothetical protein
MSQPTYNFRNIRKLLAAAFSDDELRQLCYDVPEFRGVYEEFSTGLGKDQMIQKLIAYCDRKVIMGQLLTVIAEEAPEQYALFSDNLVVGDKKPETRPSLSSNAIPSENEFLQKLITEKSAICIRYTCKLPGMGFRRHHTLSLTLRT